MKIAFIVVKGMPLGGGIEKYTEEVGSRLAERGHEVVVYAMRHYGARAGVYRGMQIKLVPSIRTRSLEKMSAALMGHLLQALEPGIDIIHAHAFGPSIFGLFPRLMGRKVVCQGHGLEWKRSRWSRWGQMVLRLTEAPSVRIPHAVTVVSRVQQAYLMKKYGRESVYIPTGVNLPVERAPQCIRERYGLAGNDYILFAARLVREKGAHYLINAYQMLKTDKKLVIAGDAEYEEEYKAELHALSRANTDIIFTGFATGQLLDELFTNCYCFVLPSEVEGLPTVLLEAMSYGNCCLASDIEENLEALADHGFTFKSRDSAALAEQLSYLLEHPAAVEAVKDQARKYVLDNFSWDSIADRFETLYSSVMADKESNERN